MVFEGLGGRNKPEDWWWSSVSDRGRKVDALYGVGAIGEIACRKDVRTRTHRAC